MSIAYVVAWSLAVAVAMGAAVAGAQTQPVAGPGGQERIVCCEQAKMRILLLDANADWRDASAIIWSWSPADSPDIRKEHVRWFINPSDAKPVMGGSHVLTCSSGGAVALIRLEDKKVVFYADAGGNPHSAALLPDGDIVTASSDGGYLRLLRTATKQSRLPDDVPSVKIKFPDAHGVVWDERRQCLWAIGGRELKRYRYDGRKPDLVEEATFTLPGNEADKSAGGHELSPDPTGDRFFVTTVRGAYQFDLGSGTFSSYEPIGQVGGVKSISQRTTGGPVIIMRATEKWWSDTIRFVGEQRTKTLPGARFYKVRWWMN